MDTKSKKFNKSVISKTIAFLLAIIMFAFSVVNVTYFFAEYFNGKMDYVESYAAELFVGDNHKNFQESDVFLDKLVEDVTVAIQGYNTFGDGSKKAYEEYQNAKKNIVNLKKADFVKKQLEALLGKSGHGSPAALFYFMSLASDDLLEFVSGHKEHYVDRAICYNGDYFYTYGSDDDYDDYDDEDYYEYDITTMPVTEPSAWYSSEGHGDIGFGISNGIVSASNDIAFQSKKEIPASVVKQVGKDAYVVELCNSVFYDDGYDGYYKINISTIENYYENNLEDFVRSEGYDIAQYNAVFNYGFDNFEQFKSSNEVFLKSMSEIKNLKIAVVDNKTGIARSNVASLDGKSFGKKDLDWFKGFSLLYKINLKTGEDKLYNSELSGDKWNDYNDRLKNHYSNGLNLQYFVANDLYKNHNNSTVYIAFDGMLKENDEFKNIESTYFVVKDKTNEMILSVAICLAIMLLCIVYLVIRSGRHSGDDELHMMRADKMFTLFRILLNLALAFGFGFLGAMLIGAIWDDNINSFLFKLALACCAALAMTFVIDLILYIARNIKNTTLIKNLFIVWLVMKINESIKNRKQEKEKTEKPIIYKDIMNDVLRRIILWFVLPNILAALAILFFWFAIEAWLLGIFMGVLLVGYDIFAVVYACKYVYYIREIIKTVNRIRNGEDVKTDVYKMPGALQGFANDVNSLNDGLRIAVEKAIKDERMKTELITNVSHDLKTPLTSIINYTDLLSRCDITDETAKGYIAVLGEKSARLKKLIEDLVEASKASSGAMKVELTSVSLNELAMQLVGEYSDEFEKRQLELIVTQHCDSIIVSADGKLAYRAFDNLMGNVKKYAMPNTRVYLDLTVENGKGIITLKNISENELNIPAEELMERFVRADSSRSTEGSGLGLSIAQNLCSLQGGKLELSISGDLFTAKISYQLSENSGQQSAVSNQLGMN